jgi:glycosyltransferase involved in cell wall biosynthesis
VLLALATLGLATLRTIGAEHIHPPQAPLGRLWETLRRHSYKLLDTVTVLTNESADWVKHNTYAQNISIIPNTASYPLSVQEPYIKPNPSGKTIIAVGRLDNQKGFDLLIDSFSNLAIKHPNWNLMIVGEGSLRSALEKQIQGLKLKSRVFLIGRVGNVGEWYESADIYAMSSRFEGFPNTLVEAMAYGLPAVSFDCDTGPRDIIRHEIDGLLVPVGDVVALTTALDRLMSDKVLRLQFAEQAIEVRERFSMEKITELWEQLFNEVSKK